MNYEMLVYLIYGLALSLLHCVRVDEKVDPFRICFDHSRSKDSHL
jgi:hypothetical protein